jgi:hypothetical protein
MSLRRIDHSSRGVLSTVARRCVWSRNLENEEAKPRYWAVKIQSKWDLTPGKQTTDKQTVWHWFRVESSWNCYGDVNRRDRVRLVFGEVRFLSKEFKKPSFLRFLSKPLRPDIQNPDSLYSYAVSNINNAVFFPWLIVFDMIVHSTALTDLFS